MNYTMIGYCIKYVKYVKVVMVVRVVSGAAYYTIKSLAMLEIKRKDCILR